MAYIEGNRKQMAIFPASIEDYVTAEDPVRAYDAFVESLNFEKLGIKIERDKIGAPAYNPKSMLKLMIYGPSYGIRSSRKLEKATYHNLSFIWIMGGLKPDHKTISKFRKDNKKQIGRVLKQCARICMKLNLIEGNVLFLDGSKFRANASIGKSWTKQKCEEELAKVDKRIDELLEGWIKADEEEDKQESLVKMEKELTDKEKLKEKIEEGLQEMEAEGKKSINLIDKECVKVKGRQGIHAGYNGQITVDGKHGLIVNSDVASASNDLGQFTNQIDQANKVLEKKAKTACADSGYSKASDLKKTVEKEIEVIVPSEKQAAHEPKKDDPFSKDKFKYDEKNNQYICPEGKILKYSNYCKSKERYFYKVKKSRDCRSCKHYGICTTNKRGRSLIRLKEEETREMLAALYETDRGQEIYKKRKEKVELPYGHIKRNLNGGYFLLRGKEGVKAEFSVLSTCFNIARMMTIIGTGELIMRLKEMVI